MTRVIDYSDPGDHRMVVQAALDALREPRLVGLPSECGYLLATSSTNGPAAEQLLQIARSTGGQAILCLAHPDQLLRTSSLRCHSRPCGWLSEVGRDRSFWSSPSPAGPGRRSAQVSRGTSRMRSPGSPARDIRCLRDWRASSGNRSLSWSPSSLREDVGPGRWPGTGPDVGGPDRVGCQRGIRLLPARSDSCAVYGGRVLVDFASRSLLRRADYPSDGQIDPVRLYRKHLPQSDG